MGITFVPRMVAETGASPDEVARAFFVAREVSVARTRWDDVEALDGVVAPDVQLELMRRYRAADGKAREGLRQLIFLSINGIAAAMQSTG